MTNRTVRSWGLSRGRIPAVDNQLGIPDDDEAPVLVVIRADKSPERRLPVAVETPASPSVYVDRGLVVV